MSHFQCNATKFNIIFIIPSNINSQLCKKKQLFNCKYTKLTIEFVKHFQTHDHIIMVCNDKISNSHT